MLEQPLMTRQTRSAMTRGGSPTSPSRGRGQRGNSRGGNRIQPIIWHPQGNQDMQMQMGGK